jgi:rubredoxin
MEEQEFVQINGEAWFIDLLFWRPSLLTDEQMQLHFSRWDGRWSDQTKRAVEQHGAKGLDLNENWALCPRLWRCPACARGKEDIFRVSKRKILLAKLELHHDHIRDSVYSRARSLFGEDWLDRVHKPSIALMDNIRTMTSRFDVCLLCSECNAADGAVKARFRQTIDPRFSFTAKEIGMFVKPRAGESHQIEFEKAFALWQAEQMNFLTRVELIDELLKHLMAGRIVRNIEGTAELRHMNAALDPGILLRQAFDQHAKDTDVANRLWTFQDELLRRSTQRDSANLAPADDRKIAAPTDEEYDNFVDPVSSKNWKATPENWKCCCCDRTKRQVVRLAKSGDWTGGVRHHDECIVERDEVVIERRGRLFPHFPNDLFIKRIEQLTLCTECAGICLSLAQRGRAPRDCYLSLIDLRKCILSCSPHARLDIDFEIASQRATVNEPYRSARAAFYAFEAKVRDFSGRFERGRRWGQSEQDLLDELSDDIKVFHRVDDKQECLSLAQWLLAQRLNC